MTHHHVKRRRPSRPSTTPFVSHKRSPEHSAVHSGRSWVCINRAHNDRAHNPPAVGSEVSRHVGRQIDDHQCSRSMKPRRELVLCCAPPGSRTQNLRIKSPAPSVRRVLPSPQNRRFVRNAVQGVLPNPPQSGEFVARLVARLQPTSNFIAAPSVADDVEAAGGSVAVVEGAAVESFPTVRVMRYSQIVAEVGRGDRVVPAAIDDNRTSLCSTSRCPVSMAPLRQGGTYPR